MLIIIAKKFQVSHLTIQKRKTKHKPHPKQQQKSLTTKNLAKEARHRKAHLKYDTCLLVLRDGHCLPSTTKLLITYILRLIYGS